MFYRFFSYFSLILVVVLSLNAQIRSLECLWNLWNIQLFLTILAANIHKEIHIESVATSFYFHLALMLESILFAKIFFPLSAPWTVSLLSFYIPPLLLSLSHQIKSLRFTFKAICSLSLPSPLSQGWYPKPAPISDQPQTPAPISQLLI